MEKSRIPGPSGEKAVNAQIIFLGIVGMILVIFVAKKIQTRSVRQYGPQELAGKLQATDPVLLLDVRTAQERSFQHIKGSLHIPLGQLSSRTHELRSHREQEIICYCQSGSRSLSAALILQKHGFRAASLRGGIVDWNFSQRPL
jgi:rhodanese-related sulfurtransferase